MTQIDDQILDTVATGSYHDPHGVLGLHAGEDGQGAREWTVRARRPLAQSVTAVFTDGTEVPLEHVRSGIWEGLRSGDPGPYHLVTTYEHAPDYVADDPYRHTPCGSSATSTTGTARATPCGRWAPAACGSSSSPRSAPAPPTSTRSSRVAANGSTRPTPWRVSRKFRRP